MATSRKPVDKLLAAGYVVSHADLVRAVCKITAYLLVGKVKDAMEWAGVLRQHLLNLGL